MREFLNRGESLPLRPSLAVGAALVCRGAHLLQDLVQPLQGPVEVDLYPAGRGRDLLPPVLLPPALHERYPDGAHPRQIVDGLEAVVDTVGEEGVELLCVEYLQCAVWWNLADGGRVPAVVLVTVWRLHEDCGVRQTLGDHVSIVMIELDTFTNVLPGLLHDAVPVEV